MFDQFFGENMYFGGVEVEADPPGGVRVHMHQITFFFVYICIDSLRNDDIFNCALS